MTEKQKKEWILLYNDDICNGKEVEKISKELSISKICAEILYNRGCKTAKEAQDFFSGENIDVFSPRLLADGEKAVKRIKKAIENKEKICIYGDYDVDGVTSVSVLYLYLKELSADVIYYIPNRIGEGYGLSTMSIEKLADDDVNLIITVDTGITAVDEVCYAKKLGIDVVVTDHHECQDILPNAEAVVNPHRPDCKYPFKSLAGVGVVFKLITLYEILYFDGVISEAQCVKNMYKKYADLVCIGTIADVMPLISENRLIVKYGLNELQNTKKIGLRMLLDVINQANNNGGKFQKKKKINSSFISFSISPRLNAAGRMDSAIKAVNLLLSNDEDEALLMAKELYEMNYNRQVEENRIADIAYRKIEEYHDFDNDKVIVLSDDDWLQGVVGIVSSRVTEKYGLPSILISFDGATKGFPDDDDCGKGSGRSVDGMNLVEALTYSKDYLVKFGGHELAAGLTIKRKDIDKFRKKINEYARAVFKKNDIVLYEKVDLQLDFSDITLQLAKEIEKLEPFGTQNENPLFMLKNIKLERISDIGDGRHSKLVLSDGNKQITALLFNTNTYQSGLVPGYNIDLLFNIDINDFMNVETAQLVVKDFRIAKDYTDYIDNEIKLHNSILAGSSFTENDIIPSRDDFVIVYLALRNAKLARYVSMDDCQMYNWICNEKKGILRYSKILLIFDIMQELGLVEFKKLDSYTSFELKESNKTSIENSKLFQKIKTQLK